MWSRTVAHIRYGRQASEMRVQVASSGGLGESVQGRDRVPADLVDHRDRVGDAAAAQQDPGRGPRPDAGQCLELREGFGLGQCSQPFRVEDAVQRGPREIVEAADLDLAQAGHRRDLEQALRSRERSDDLAADLDLVAEPVGEALLDDPCLPHRDPLADDERGGRLVRRVEADRPEPVVLRLKRADHRIARADLGPAAAVVIERQRARCLAANRLEIVRAVCLAVDGPVGRLPHVDRGAVAPAFDGERHEQAGVRAMSADPGREPTREILGGGQREGADGIDRECLQPGCASAVAANAN